ncbi:hypothetical protein DXX93_14780 [Thalassotalea euphylliae]|uniref:Alpha/beta hydrolase n=1 Tax=Thalassotalea euphylliae TaxID=1655234 RepID=A0A3E0TTM6_9GAMM|nr:hypothetical protein [Thalassotalea euphylliae]REL27697.1 hypothetical protein DXX93_14780 [Thalassotalea euphylliae]
MDAPWFRQGLFTILWLSVVFTTSSCVAPYQTFQSAAARHHLATSTINTPLFEHVIFQNSNPIKGKLHIYFTGDGTPWRQGKVPALDPTPQSSLTLALLVNDPTAAMILGRPCYHGLYQETACHYQLWTSKRYAEQVITSMYMVLAQIAEGLPSDTELVLIGYSGGATIASLLAQYQSYQHHLHQQKQHQHRQHKSQGNKLNIRRVVSIAGNQDITAWADHHRVPRLYGSLNPMLLPKASDNIEYVFLAGANDRTVLPVHSRVYAERQTNYQFILYDTYDHYCCWQAAWPTILTILGED